MLSQWASTKISGVKGWLWMKLANIPAKDPWNAGRMQPTLIHDDLCTDIQ